MLLPLLLLQLHRCRPIDLRISLTDNPTNRAQGEQFADWMEDTLRRRGITGEFFCESQYQLWREHAVRAYLGQSPRPEENPEKPSEDATHL